jgi:predicted phage tail protein
VAKPGTPYGLQAKGGDGKVVLTWTAPLESADSSIQGYRVYRGNSSQDMKLYDVATGATYTDLNVINGHTYYYRVSAVNATGEGRMSNEASTTPSSPPQDIMSLLGRYWLEIVVIVIAVLVVVGTIFIMFGSGMLSLGKKEDE